MGNAGRVITAIVADLVIGGFGYAMLTSDLGEWDKAIGALIVLIAISAVTTTALGGDKKHTD
jgi:hypothetical protein